MSRQVRDQRMHRTGDPSVGLEQALEQLRPYAQDVPSAALDWIRANWSEAEPAFLGVLAEALKDPFAETTALFVYSLYLCAEMESEPAFERYVAICRLPGPQLRVLTGDILTEHMPMFLARTCAGRVPQLKSLIEDRTVAEYARSMALRTFARLVLHRGELPVSELEVYVLSLLDGGLELETSHVWDTCVSLCCDMCFKKALPLIEDVYTMGLADEGCITLEEVKEDFRAGAKACREAAVKYHCRPPLPAEEAMSVWRRGWGEDHKPDPDELLAVLSAAPRPLSHRQGRKIGRNEPCPCGSGKKFKKCCLNKIPVPQSVYGRDVPEKDRGLNRWLEAGYIHLRADSQWEAMECWLRFWEELMTRIPPELSDPADDAMETTFEGRELIGVWLDEFKVLLDDVAGRSTWAAARALRFTEDVLTCFPRMSEDAVLSFSEAHAEHQLELGRTAEAVNEFEELMERWPDHVPPYLRLAEILSIEATDHDLVPDLDRAEELLTRVDCRTQEDDTRRLDCVRGDIDALREIQEARSAFVANSREMSVVHARQAEHRAEQRRERRRQKAEQERRQLSFLPELGASEDTASSPDAAE
ncbi:MAG: DUF1186 domain-containing protein [Lentisphaerae bacterium]|jgi:uncharacterized protein|nr:DUF1186 domain-containing protein [Lentisphaerota bacterium]MBT5609581.1 DUF1186 domain-containing protein [Lentisphaerota bacterium]MBT7057777.1 DUF1186 domain-containing protein [Lentisphaerota bacterium]MBT7843196.1 DUF1186 domain-containing protein [Lentisphaerota bacterium]